MRKGLLFLLLISITVFTACAHGRKTTKSKKKAKAATAASVRGLSAVTMRRGACFGRCPEYLLTINSNGMAEYVGKRNTTPLGTYQKNIGAAAAQKLLRSFMDYRADTCRELYTSRIADLPGLHYTLTINGKKKSIANANFGPDYLIRLSEEVDGLGQVDGSWKKISDMPTDE
jgi:hypothetical protein